jgi:hypothetical protein
VLFGCQLGLVIFQLFFDFLDVPGETPYFCFKVVEVFVELLNITN